MMKRAKTYDEIRPLIELCKGGKLFEVQAWIAAGKPVNPPKALTTGHRKRSPMEYAIKTGFHSLVQLLLDGGAEIEQADRYSAMNHALWEHKCEIAKLLLDYGADVRKVDMYDVFSTWKTDLMEDFIARGGDVETRKPLARAFCQRIETTLKIYKRYETRFPSFREQANIALRHHCREGNTKWVELMIWLGADPYARGPDNPLEKPQPNMDGNAIEVAACHGQEHILALKKLRIDPKHESSRKLLFKASFGRSAAILKRLLEAGCPANDLPTGGSSYVGTVLTDMCMGKYWGIEDLDIERPRAKLPMLEVLVQHGARWVPQDAREMNRVRQELLAAPAEQTVEVIRIMAEHGGCERKVMEAFIGTPAMQTHLARHMMTINDLIARLP